jgi:pimeloyl-ACP methyl ester carboxylesterase
MCLVGLLVCLAGCVVIGVRPAEERTLFDTWLLSLNPGQSVSLRTLQTLRQLDLEPTFQSEPFQAYQKLVALTTDEAPADQIFALAELSYRFGRECEVHHQPQTCQYYYLCAGYSYHYLFSLIRPGANQASSDSSALAAPNLAGQAKVLPFNCFDPRFRLACELYNHSLEKCIREVQRHGTLDARQAIELPTQDGAKYQLSVTHHGFPWRYDEFGPLLFCNDYDVIGLDNHYRGFGLGVPMIGARLSADRRPGEDGRNPSNYFKSVHFPVTAFFRFSGGVSDLLKSRSGTLELHNPLAIQTVQVAGFSVPLETDLTTPLAYTLEKTDLATLPYTGFIWANEVQRQEGIYMFEPYQKGKIPVLMVHGLLSSPLTWAPLFNDLQADPVLREKYQYWFYLYPTGKPYLGTAADLRQSLTKLREEIDPRHEDAALDNMVCVGHSMGGLINKLLTISGGDDFWQSSSTIALPDLKVAAATRSELQQVFYFEPIGGIKRVIFIATPHHGSKLSPSLLGRWGKKLVKLPKQFSDSLLDVMTNNPTAWKDHFWESPTSVDLLDPSAPALQILGHRPRPAGVHYHSVVGIIKKNNILQEARDVFNWDDAPGDGVVRYDSAHLADAESEVIVQADHMKVHHHPRAVQEVRRILYLHLQELGSGPVQPVELQSVVRPALEQKP